MRHREVRTSAVLPVRLLRSRYGRRFTADGRIRAVERPARAVASASAGGCCAAWTVVRTASSSAHSSSPWCRCGPCGTASPATATSADAEAEAEADADTEAEADADECSVVRAGVRCSASSDGPCMRAHSAIAASRAARNRATSGRGHREPAEARGAYAGVEKWVVTGPPCAHRLIGHGDRHGGRERQA
jgi:hypothetical protein